MPFFPEIGKEPVHLMVVDDSKVQRDLAVRRLKHNTVIIHTAADFKSAKEKIDELQRQGKLPVGYILDVDLGPDEDGYDLYRHIRKTVPNDADGKSPFILFHSSENSLKDTVEGFQKVDPKVHWIAKPSDQEPYREIVERLLHGRTKTTRQSH